jgi:hypothetical protein
LAFNSFETESGWDFLTIYDGPGVSSPLIGVYDGTNSPGTVVSTHSSGSLTFFWESDFSNTFSGWEAEISTVQQSEEPEPSELPAIYPFSGNANDIENGNNADVFGASLTVDRFGNSASAYSFDGVNDYMSINGGEGIIHDGDITYFAFVRPTINSNQVIIFDDALSGFGDMILYIPYGDEEMRLSYQYDSGSGDSFNLFGSIVIPLNEWTMVAITRSGSEISYYVNGQFDVSGFATNPVGASNPKYIGGTPSGSQPFNGGLDEVRIYGRALDADEILTLYNDLNAQVDFTISNARVNNPVILPGSTDYEISYDFQNLGSSPYPESTLTGFILSTTPNLDGLVEYWASFEQPGIDANATDPFDLSFTSVPFPDVDDGDYYILVYADVGFEVPELDETNNINADIQITVTSDVADPTVSINAPAEALPGTVEVPIQANDDVGVVLVEFYVKRALAPASSYQVTNLTSSGSSTFIGTVEASDFDDIGVSMYAVAYDAAGKFGVSDVQTITRSIPSNETQVVSGIQVGSSIEDYQIIAYPYDATSTSVVLADLGTQSDENWRIFSYNGNLDNPYSNNVSRLDPGRGYWLIVNNGVTSVSFTGASPVKVDESSPFSINLNSGWNLIGNPYLAGVDWNEVIRHNVDRGEISTEDIGQLITYNSGYRASTSLSVYEGAFVFGFNSLQLEIPFSALNGRLDENEIGPRPFIYEEGGWEMIMDVSIPDGLRYGVAGFGEMPAAEDGQDKYDMTIPPMFNQFISIRFKEDGINSLTRSIKSVNTNQRWDFEVESNSTVPTAMDLDFYGYPDLNDGEKIVLFDEQTGTLLDISNETSYTFTFLPGYTFRVIKGDDEYINEETMISNIMVNTIYPNPASDQVSVPLVLPSGDEYSVLLSLTDLSGKVIRTMDPVLLDGGIHELQFDLRGVASSGMHIMMIEVNQSSQDPVLYNRKLYLNK